VHGYERLAVLMATALLMAVATACGSDEDSGGGGGAAGDGVRKPSEIRVGVILKTFANEYWTAMRDGAQAKAEELGVPVEIDAASSEAGTDEQVSKLEAMISADYDCYAVAPITGTNLIQPLVPVSRDGTTIVDLDAPFSTKDVEAAGVELATYISSNHEQAGVLGAEEMAKDLGDKASGAQVALIGGIPGDTASAARLQGFEDTAKASGIEIVQKGNADWDRDKALTLAGDILRARPDLAGFFAANDTMALGIAQAAQNAGKGGEIVIIGVDGAKSAEEAIQQGAMTATVAQFPYAVGAIGVESCVAAVQGQTLPERVDSPLAVINKDNVDEALAAYPAPFQKVEDPIAELVQE
jgi:ABC-type sugar transport system substrate-binding protein